MSKLEGDIYKNGYGIISRKVMRDKNLSFKAKALYAYLCSFAGYDDIVYPSVKLITEDLNISKDTFFKYVAELRDSGYISIQKHRDSGQKFSNNVYKIEKNNKYSQMKYKDYLETEHWKKLRKKALRHAKYSCQLCNSKESLNVHHRTYERKGEELLSDLIVLCQSCHGKFHDKIGTL